VRLIEFSRLYSQRARKPRNERSGDRREFAFAGGDHGDGAEPPLSGGL